MTCIQCLLEYLRRVEKMMQDKKTDESMPSSKPLLSKLEPFKKLYNTLNKDTLSLRVLGEVYADNIHFEDCFHNINGLEAMFEYFDNLYENVSFIHFDFEHEWINEERAMLTWTMSYKHPRLNAGKVISVQGASQLDFEQNKIIRHRDYFDGGALLYEHIPILKQVIHLLKKRTA